MLDISAWDNTNISSSSHTNIIGHSNQLYLFIKSLSNGDAVYVTSLFNCVLNMIKTDAHLEEENSSLENEIVNNINTLISAHLTNNANASRNSKCAVATDPSCKVSKQKIS